MIAWRQLVGRVQAGQGRKPAEPVVRSASLDGPAAVRQLLGPSDHDLDPFDEPDRQCEVRAVPRRALICGRLSRRSGAAHLAWCCGRLSKNNVQTNAYDHIRPAAHRGFYLAIARSAASSSPFRRAPSPNCDERTEDQTPGETDLAGGSLQSMCRGLDGRTSITRRIIAGEIALAKQPAIIPASKCATREGLTRPRWSHG